MYSFSIVSLETVFILHKMRKYKKTLFIKHFVHTVVYTTKGFTRMASIYVLIERLHWPICWQTVYGYGDINKAYIGIGDVGHLFHHVSAWRPNHEMCEKCVLSPHDSQHSQSLPPERPILWYCFLWEWKDYPSPKKESFHAAHLHQLLEIWQLFSSCVSLEKAYWMFTLRTPFINTSPLSYFMSLSTQSYSAPVLGWNAVRHFAFPSHPNAATRAYLPSSWRHLTSHLHSAIRRKTLLSKVTYKWGGGQSKRTIIKRKSNAA